MAIWVADRRQGTSGLSGVRGREKGRWQEAVTASASTDSGGKQEVGKKKKLRAVDWSTDKRISVRREDKWDLQKILDGKKGSLWKTHKSQMEAKDKVWASEQGNGEGLGDAGDSLRALRAG